MLCTGSFKSLFLEFIGIDNGVQFVISNFLVVSLHILSDESKFHFSLEIFLLQDRNLHP